MLAGHKGSQLLSWAVAAIWSLFPISAHAAIDWIEEFEYVDDTAFTAVWDSSGLGNPGVSTDRAFNGLKSAKETFRGHAGKDPGAGGCFMNRKLNEPSETLYTRVYMYMDNFTVDSTSTKMFSQGGDGYPSFYWIMPWGKPTLSVGVVGIIKDSGKRDSENVYGAAIPQNQWVCLETRITMSTPGVDDGIIQAWIDGEQVINKTNQRMRGATINQNNLPDAKFKTIQLYTQNGRGNIYYDDLAVSRDARLGYIGSPTPPSAPSALPTGKP
jgi:hypothetical protein